jgi:hypothetical protein
VRAAQDFSSQDDPGGEFYDVCAPVAVHYSQLLGGSTVRWPSSVRTCRPRRHRPPARPPARPAALCVCLSVGGAGGLGLLSGVTVRALALET